MTTDLDLLDEQIDNALMDDAMRCTCGACGKLLGYMNSSWFKSGDEYDWVFCQDCFVRTSEK